MPPRALVLHAMLALLAAAPLAVRAGALDLAYGSLMQDAEQVSFYPAYAYRDGERWVIPLRAWVHEPRPLAESLIARLAAGFGELDEAARANFRSRAADFVADSESGEAVALAFDHDPQQAVFRLRASDGSTPATDLNGAIEGRLELSAERAAELLQAQGAADGWLAFHAVSPEHSGRGRVRLIAPEGLSVISDIDDTIKHTDIVAGARVVMRNTFFAEFAAAPGMAERYRAWDGAAFHYVSGSPWQLYRPLAGFLFEGPGAFPAGSLHMKAVGKNLLSAATWETLARLVSDPDVTYRQKIAQIGTVIGHFPQRRFILVGDSGEKDPEVYREISRRFPDQVQQIIIRDVRGDASANPARLAGMTVLRPDGSPATVAPPTTAASATGVQP